MPSDCSAIFQVEANVMGDIVLTISNRLEENVNDEVCVRERECVRVKERGTAACRPVCVCVCVCLCVGGWV